MCLLLNKVDWNFEYNLIQYTFAPVHLNRLMKKGGGIGPMKPWQPAHIEKGAKSDPIWVKISLARHPSCFIVTNGIE